MDQKLENILNLALETPEEEREQTESLNVGYSAESRSWELIVKYHGSQKYTTDGISAARMKDYCERAKVPYQTYANRSDIAGGSTLGNISTAHVSVSSVDIGLPQLAMHSAVETAGMKDTEYAVRALKEFWGE